MKNKWKWGVIIALILAAWFGGCRYGTTRCQNTRIVDTATARIELDTVYLPEVNTEIPGDTVYAKTPQSRPDTVRLPGETVYDTVYTGADTPQWLVDIANDWSAIRSYDTTITRNGDTIRIRDRVSKNKLLPRRITAVWHDTTITKTTVIRPPRRYVGSFTLSAGGWMDGTTSAAIGFQLKNRYDRTYQIEYQRVFGLKQPIVMATVSFPIRLLGKPKN